jgi:hypothetical protein
MINDKQKNNQQNPCQPTFRHAERVCRPHVQHRIAELIDQELALKAGRKLAEGV